MKKFWKIFKFVFVGLLMCISFVYVTYSAYYEWILWYWPDLEIASYAIWLIGFALCFYEIVDICEKSWAKITSALATSLVYTLVVFLANNFWKYISINNDFEWEDPLTYADVLKWDIGYTYQYGWLRYPVVFAIMFVICAAKILWSRPKIAEKRNRLVDRIGYRIYIFDLKCQNFGELYYDVVEDIKEDKLIDYVDNMSLTEKNKNMLIRFIEVKKDPFLIRLLFSHFEGMITKEEYIKYRNLYVKLTKEHIKAKQEYYASAKVEFSSTFKRLDNKFGILDEG